MISTVLESMLIFLFFFKMSSQLRRLYKVDFGIIIFNDKLEICGTVFEEDLSLHKLYNVECDGDYD